MEPGMVHDCGNLSDPEFDMSSSEIDSVMRNLSPVLDPEVISSLNIQFPDVDHHIHDSCVGQARLQEPQVSGADRNMVEGRHTHEQPGSMVTPQLTGSLAPVVDGPTNSSGPIYGNNSVAVADFSCHADEERKGSGVMAGFVGEYNDALSLVQTGPSSMKHVRKESKLTYTIKGAKKDQYKPIDLLPRAVRSRRSCLSRTPHALQSGSADILSEQINQSCEDQELGFTRDNGKDGEQKKAQIGGSSEGYEGVNFAFSDDIRVRLKLGEKSRTFTLRGRRVRTDSVADVSRDGIKFSNSVVNLEKPGTSQERTEGSVQPLDNDIETALSSGKSCVLGSSDNSDKEVEKSEFSTDDRHLNSGSSMMSKTDTIISDGIVKQIMQSHTAWVCCDDCSKWRRIPAKLADIIGETNCKWTCKDNEEKAYAGCSIPQEKSDDEINVELNISGDEDGQGAYSDAKCNNMIHSAASLQSPWMLIKSNIFLHRSRKTQSLDEMMICHCKLPRDGNSGCGDECLNRMLNIECAQETCPCGQFCSNQQFQKREYADLQWFRCGKKGYGLEVLEDISEGRFIIEYVGEVLGFSTYEARQKEYASKGHKHFYFMTLNANEVIDACTKGNLGRFINHSCDPNCRTEKWMVNGEICIGFFAARDIKKREGVQDKDEKQFLSAGEELTFDYNYVRVFGAAAKKCHCGSSHCRGYIGGDPLNSELIVQGDSDEEFPEPVVIYENGDLSESLGARPKPRFLDVVGKKNGDNIPQQAAIVLPGCEEIINKVEATSTSLQGGSLFTEKDEVHHSVAECSQVQSSSEILVDPSMEIGDKISNDFQEKESTSDRIDTTFLSGNKPISGALPRMKICRLSRSVNGKESCISRTIINKDSVINSTTNNRSMINRSPFGSSKPNILVESSAKHLLEGVEQKLNELLDSVGGIRKQKDAFKGYLKLLYQTAASGDGSHREIIQSNKDLSMVLDAILKTKSRRVLTDIINKNGLQMLHLMMKKCRDDFSMIPILRKLLKVFEYLAERRILTVEDINGDSHRPGVESFRDSVLSLTEHQDWKVHQTARSFRDSWIRRPARKYNHIEKSNQKMELNRAPNYSTFPGYMKHSPSPSHMIDAKMPESASLHPVECKTDMRTCLKRKSRWDQPSASVSLHSTEAQGIKLSSRVNDERQEMEKDAPPGFSIPLNAPLKCPSNVPLGHVQQKFNSKLPVAYGIPLKAVLEFGTPQAAIADGWVIAPGGPFHSFPPPPLHPRKGE